VRSSSLSPCRYRDVLQGDPDPRNTLRSNRRGFRQIEGFSG
jgi:hypothetical protein